MTEQRQCILIADDDEAVTTGLSMTLSRPERTTIVCSDVESAEVALTRFEVTHVVTDIQFSGEFGFEGLHFVSRIRRLRPDCRIVVMTGNASDSLRREAIRHGAAAVLSKPFDSIELEQALGGTGTRWDTASEDESNYQTFRIPPIDEILSSGGLAAAFQPIARLEGTRVSQFGFEALTRARGDWMMGGPALVFDYAERCKKLDRLNLVTMTGAVEAASALPADAAIFINIDPLTFDGGELVPLLRSTAERTGIDLARVVLEVTERSAFPDDAVAAGVFDELRDLGVRFALDDHGSAYSHLSLIDRIRPTYIKISQTFGTGFEHDSAKERIIRHIVALAHDFGCETILEGIETTATARAAAALGVTLAQGYFFGRPRTASHWTAAKASTAGSILPSLNEPHDSAEFFRVGC